MGSGQNNLRSMHSTHPQAPYSNDQKLRELLENIALSGNIDGMNEHLAKVKAFINDLNMQRLKSVNSSISGIDAIFDDNEGNDIQIEMINTNDSQIVLDHHMILPESPKSIEFGVSTKL